MRFLLLSLVLFMFSCGVENKQSNTQVVNGVETVSYPAVASLKLFRSNGSVGLCTGTFIQRDLILTASHCVDGVVGVEALGHQAVKIVSNKDYSYTFSGLPHDFAFVKFAKNISEYTMRVSNKRLKEGSPLTLVGYGVNNYRPYRSGAGKKRIGFNTYKLNDYLERGIVQFEGYQITQTERGTYFNASVGQGDSGGPLISNGEIVGVASAQALYNDVNSSYYAYTVSRNFTYFYDRAMRLLK